MMTKHQHKTIDVPSSSRQRLGPNADYEYESDDMIVESYGKQAHKNKNKALDSNADGQYDETDGMLNGPLSRNTN